MRTEMDSNGFEFVPPTSFGAQSSVLACYTDGFVFDSQHDSLFPSLIQQFITYAQALAYVDTIKNVFNNNYM